MTLKKRQNLILFFVLCLSIFSGCSEDEPNDPAENSGEITFTVGDKSFSLTNIEAVIREGFLDVSASNGKEEILSISHRAGLAIQEFDLTSEGPLFLNVVYLPHDGGSNYGPFGQTPAGKFVITSINELKQTMTGTFEGVLVRYEDHEDEMAITGSFTFPYTIEDYSPTKPFYLYKVNGTDFNGGIRMFGFSGDHLQINSRNGASGIYIQVVDDAVGIYSAGVIGDHNTYARYYDGINSYGSTSGTVTITSNEIGTTGIITGTYSFKLESYPVRGNEISVTEGTFTVQKR
jgi:hypothetical protein